MPQVELIDMREEFLDTRKQTHVFAARWSRRCRRKLEAGEQTMLLMNRRGFSASWPAGAAASASSASTAP